MSEFRIQEHYSPIKTPKQLLTVAVLSFVVPIFVIVGVVQLITGGLHTDPTHPAMSEEATAQRLQPVGQVVVGEQSTPTPAPASPAVAAPATKTETLSGDKVFQSTCAMCHTPGVAGAPKLGDKTAWKSRIAQGKDALYQNAIKGIRMMPAKGGNAALGDDSVKAAVDYMVAQSK
jgi:cytochrome c5